MINTRLYIIATFMVATELHFHGKIIIRENKVLHIHSYHYHLQRSFKESMVEPNKYFTILLMS